MEVSHLRNVLESAGIRCHIRNDRLSGALGEIPFVECWPELWVDSDGDVLRARGLLDDEQARRLDPGTPWTCVRCGERLEGQFSECWRCADSGEEA